MTLTDFENLLLQPFGRLPTSCDEMDHKVRQVRLCVEVLRRYLAANHLPAAGSSAEAKLEKAEQSYRLAAYQSLLIKLGISYDELRLSAQRRNEGA